MKYPSKRSSFYKYLPAKYVSEELYINLIGKGNLHQFRDIHSKCQNGKILAHMIYYKVKFTQSSISSVFEYVEFDDINDIMDSVVKHLLEILEEHNITERDFVDIMIKSIYNNPSNNYGNAFYTDDLRVKKIFKIFFCKWVKHGDPSIVMFIPDGIITKKYLLELINHNEKILKYKNVKDLILPNEYEEFLISAMCVNENVIFYIDQPKRYFGYDIKKNLMMTRLINERDENKLIDFISRNMSTIKTGDLEIFKECCSNGFTKLINFICNTEGIILDSKFKHECLDICVEKNHFDIFKIIIDQIKGFNKEKIIDKLSEFKRFEMLKFLYTSK